MTLSEDSAEFGNCSGRKHSEPAVADAAAVVAAAALMIVASVDGRATEAAVVAATASVAVAAEGNEVEEGTRSEN